MAVLRKYHPQPDTMSPAYEVPLFSAAEMEKLNHLVGSALIDRKLCNRLVVQRDSRLREEFNLKAATWAYIAALHAPTLEDLCEAILQAQTRGSM